MKITIFSIWLKKIHRKVNSIIVISIQEEKTIRYLLILSNQSCLVNEKKTSKRGHSNMRSTNFMLWDKQKKSHELFSNVLTNTGHIESRTRSFNCHIEIDLLVRTNFKLTWMTLQWDHIIFERMSFLVLSNYSTRKKKKRNDLDLIWVLII